MSLVAPKPPASQLGGVLVEPGSVSAHAAEHHLTALRERLGPAVAMHYRWAGQTLPVAAEVALHLRGNSAAGALAVAGAQAATTGHLLVLLAPLLPDAAAIAGLLTAFEADDLVGFAEPRFGNQTDDTIWFLPDGGEPGREQLPRQGLSLLPEHYLTTEHLAACVLIRREVAAGLGSATHAPEQLRAALLLEMCLARRRGFRTVVMNRVVVPSAEPRAALYPVLDAEARGELHARYPDVYAAEQWFHTDEHQRRERLVARARRARPTARLSVLLDCRGVPGYHNGTSEAVLGLLDGLATSEPDWQVDLMFGAEPARYHQVGRRYPGMRLRIGLPDQSFAAAVCLNQPWHLSTVADLHRRGLAVAFNILDTIAWDVVYLGNPEMAKTWRFVAEHADGLLYISEFTRRRFNFRFPVMPSVAESVIRLSLSPDEYRATAAGSPPEDDAILVFGNQYDHKAVTPTLDVLGSAFPFRQIKALGASAEPRRNVTVLQSGHLSDAEIDRLIATARVVVFPSYYEGFGLPVVKALAYGRTVVVRSSPLWREIAGLTRMPGRLVEFLAPHELVEAVGKVLAGEPVHELAQGGDLPPGAAPLSWRDCARGLVELVEQVVAEADTPAWYRRDRALALAGL